MRRYRVKFQPLAEADLFELYRYIAKEASHGIAGAFVDRIEAACMALQTFPQRGTRRDDIRRGLRTMGFERRATIVFQVKRAEVLIVRILYGGRNLDRILRRTTGT